MSFPELSRVRRICFLTGTRADFGKIKPLITEASQVKSVKVTVIVTGMHLLDLYGHTVNEVRALDHGIEIVEFSNQCGGERMDEVFAATASGLVEIVEDLAPDLLVVHGDRLEALAGAAIGALRGVVVAHIEGGELSGTVDGVLRHAISKLSNVHLVANAAAARRIIQLGESPDSVWTIGSPDVDIMLSASLPALRDVKEKYEIPFSNYGIAILHAVTTQSREENGALAEAMMAAIKDSQLPFVVIYPNNDRGSDAILDVLKTAEGNENLRTFPSLRFEAFLSLLKGASVMVGNSSAGIREAPVYGVPTVNIGSRQRGRFEGQTSSVVDVGGDYSDILEGIKFALKNGRDHSELTFGDGLSAQRFGALIADPEFWERTTDKVFNDLPVTED